MKVHNSTKIRLARYRRPLAAVFAAAAMGLALLAVRPAPPPSVRVVAAARDLPGGATLKARDLRMVALPAAAVPDGAVRSFATSTAPGGAGAAGTDAPPGSPDRTRRLLAGRVLAGPVRRGELITDARLVSAGLLDGYGPDTVATPVRIADAGSVRLLRAGDRIDVLAPAGDPADAVPPEPAPPPPARAHLVVAAVPVLAVPREPPGDHGALVVLATNRAQAAALAGAGPRLSMAIVPAQ